MKLAVFLWFLITSAWSHDLGCYGETFAIAETSLLKIIHDKLNLLSQEDNLKHYQELIQERMVKSIKNPKEVRGVGHTTQPRSFTFNPTFVLDHDMVDHQGNVLYLKGTRINPLHDVSLSKPLLLADGKSHVSWIKEQLKHTPNAKVILVKGNPFDLEEQLGCPVYFDQGGVLCSKLGILQVPARITQEKDQLLIQEVFLTEVMP